MFSRFRRMFAALGISAAGSIVIASTPAVPVLMIAHRGAYGPTIPENTLEAFLRAMELGATHIELDIRRSKSGELVLHHDEMLGRLLPGSGLIGEHTLDELKALSMAGEAKIATLEELFAVVPVGITFVLDLKDDQVAALVAPMVEREIRERGRLPEHFYATGFMHQELVDLKHWLPFMRLVPAIAGQSVGLANYAKAMNAYGVCLLNMPGIISEAFVGGLRESGLQVWMYHPKGMSDFWVKRIAPDALIIDYPI